MDTGTLQLEIDVHLLSLEFGTNLDFLFIVGKKLEEKKNIFTVFSIPDSEVLDRRQKSKTHHSQRVESAS